MAEPHCPLLTIYVRIRSKQERGLRCQTWKEAEGFATEELGWDPFDNQAKGSWRYGWFHSIGIYLPG